MSESLINYLATWHRGKNYGRGELAASLLESIREEIDGRAILNVNAEWFREVSKLKSPENDLYLYAAEQNQIIREIIKAGA